MTLSFTGNRQEFLNLLKLNQGVMIFKFTADWCKPCQTIKEEVNAHFEKITSNTVQCFEVDVDEAFDLYAFMKTKKMVKGIPTMMAYVKGNHEFYPDDSISGAELAEVDAFFQRCSSL